LPLNIEACWTQPVPLRRATAGAIYDCHEIDELTAEAGIYVFYRKHGERFEPLYVGKSTNIRKRVVQHLNSVRLMTAIKEAGTGGRYVIGCQPLAKPGQDVNKVLKILENGLIDYFMAQGFSLKQKQGTNRPNHQIHFTGNRSSEALVERSMRVRI
jgi:hypothetical protein